MNQDLPDAHNIPFNSLAARESLLQWALGLVLMKENLSLPNNSSKTCEREEENAEK